ncbi:hypothetical protein [Streptomyces alkaliterrae]|uniref:SbtR family transcriptional regulator n=1 Tax=Streptomyces alkaliterrae TaxID=2213162 RepID=UPI003F6A42FF
MRHFPTREAPHAPCATMRASGTRLLVRAQAAGPARTDIDGTDLFAPAGALAWLGGQPPSAPRADHHLGIAVSAILTGAPSGGTGGGGWTPPPGATR